MQIFGVHKVEIKGNEKRYLIEFKEEVDKSKIQLSSKEFREFNSFKSEDIKIFTIDILNIHNNLRKSYKNI